MNKINRAMSEISKIEYKDFYTNQKFILDTDSEEYELFWEEEEYRCKHGVYVEDEFFNLYLYWHLNFWKTDTSVKGLNGRLIEKYIALGLRDNEWIIFNAIYEAEKQQKGLCIMGSRRIGKSVISSSYLSHGATFDPNSQNIISGLNSDDIKLVTDKIDKGLNILPKRFQWMRIEDNWKKQVTLGIKYKDGRREPFSQILIRNLDNGNNPEAIAGTKPRKLFIDECAKGLFMQGLQAAEPGFTTLHGWGCSPILCATGGDASSFADAKKLFFSLNGYNFLEFDDLKTKRKTGLFLGHTYRQEAKVEGSLGSYLDKPEDSHLYDVLMMYADSILADEITDANRERKGKTGNNEDLIREIMYFPKTVDDIFMNGNDNNFPLEEIEKVLTYIKENRITGQYVRLKRNANNKVNHKFADMTDKLIQNWLAEKWENKDTLIQVWEFLEPNALWGLYVAGCLLLGERVMTDKGLRLIEEVDINEKLISKDGDLIGIKALLRYDVKDAETYNVLMSNTYSLTIFTEEHLLYVSKLYYRSDKTIDFSKMIFDFKKVKDVSVGDFIKVLNTYNKEIFFNDVNEELYWLFGLYIGDGWINNKSDVGFAINNNELETVERVRYLANKFLNKEIKVRQKDGCVHAIIKDEWLYSFVKENFGHHSNGKFINNDFKYLSKVKKSYLVCGYLDSDGCLTEDKKRNYFNINFVSINLRLVEDFQDIIFSLNTSCSLRKLRDDKQGIIQGRIVNQQITYSLDMSNSSIKEEIFKYSNKFNKVEILKKTAKAKDCFVNEDYIYIKIKNIEKSNYTGIVYNFETETNTYMCRYITTHNLRSI